MTAPLGEEALAAIEALIAKLDTDEYNQGVPKGAPWRAAPSCSGPDKWIVYQPTGSDRSRIIAEGLRQPFADFIAAARSDVPRLVAALREARREKEPYPCPTVRPATAIVNYLDGEGEAAGQPGPEQTP